MIDTGFVASLTTDPTIVGDISGNGRINAADASRVAQFAALIPVPEIPPVPGGIVINGVPDRTAQPLFPVPGGLEALVALSGDVDASSEALGFVVVPGFLSTEVEQVLATDLARDQALRPGASEVDQKDSLFALEQAIDELLSPE